MASASSTSAKNLFVDSKLRLAERVQVNVNNFGSICRQVLRGSRSAELLSHSARNMALQEHAIENSEENLKKLNLLVTHLGYQQEAIQRYSFTLDEVKEQHHSGLVTQQPELFFSGESVRPGILVLINDADWELNGQLEYHLEDKDKIVFISTLHGG